MSHIPPFEWPERPQLPADPKKRATSAVWDEYERQLQEWEKSPVRFMANNPTPGASDLRQDLHPQSFGADTLAWAIDRHIRRVLAEYGITEPD